MALAFAFLLLLLVPASGASASAAPSAQYGGPIVATFYGPSLIANSSTHEYIINATGGPLSGGNYSYTAFVSEKNSTGLSVSPSAGTSAAGVFYMNLTTGPAAGVVTLKVNITAGTGDQQVASIKQFLITVVNPIVITVPVTNQGTAGVQNANISLYINSRFISAQTVSLSAGQSTNVTFDWLEYHYPSGNNVATVTVVSNGTLLFANGQAQTSFNVYVPGNTANTIDSYIILGCVVAAVLLFMIYFRKPKPRF